MLICLRLTLFYWSWFLFYWSWFLFLQLVDRRPNSHPSCNATESGDATETLYLGPRWTLSKSSIGPPDPPRCLTLAGPARGARPPPGFGRTVVLDTARLLSLDAAMASGSSKHARRVVDGVEPLRITSARLPHRIPLGLTEDNFLTTRRLRQNHYTPTPIIHAPLPPRTYVDPPMDNLRRLPLSPALQLMSP